MVTLNRILLLCLTLCLSSHALAVEMQASLDTETVNMGDTVELTVTINEQVFNSEPDFSVLKQDFDVLSKRQSSQYSMINGRITSSTSWIITLLPKRLGYIAVPSIVYEGARSKPVKLHVQKRKNVDPKSTNELLFVDASIDKTEAYVQEQLIYTIRVFWSSIELFDSSFSAPEIEDAVMEQLGDRRKYRSTINGRNYEVIEFRYAVFPQKSGTMKIAPAEVMATVFAASRRSFGRDPFNGKQVRRISPELNVNVKPKPDSYPANKPWLPTRSLKLYENWSPDSNEIKIGEPITRGIIIEAEGLVNTLLPPVATPNLPGIKIYPEQANTNSAIGSNGIVSKRVESQAIIATKAGTVELPGIDITWWDVNEEKVKVTSVPPRVVKVMGSGAGLQTNNTTTPAPAPLPGSVDAAPLSLQPATNPNTTWQWTALGSLGLWLITLALFIWLYFSKKQSDQPLEPSNPPFNNGQFKAAQKALKNACEQNNPKLAKKALIELFRQLWEDNGIKNLNHIAQRANNEPLKSAFDEMEKQLYKSPAAEQEWDARFLMNAVEEVMAKKEQQSKQKQLAPLYPA